MADAQSVVVSWPQAALFRFPPTNAPVPVAPAPAAFSMMRPFNIAQPLYASALEVTVPLTVATVYAVAVKALNRYNGSRNKQPWAISKTGVFHMFVVAHNVLLAVYSAWTFVGMLATMGRAIVAPTHPDGLAATVDSLCRLHGPPGLGASAYFNETTRAWQSIGQPAQSGMDPSSMGRIWNEGLAYYGWIFYLSKFYEVLDTLIILAKGKSSSTLQTYHHAGAMICMWAGMRYMSAPIWMFVLVNSFIHSLMYTYYTLTAFGVKVPVGVKRALTSMQITQFLVGATYAMAHSFLQYLVPVTTSKTLTVPHTVSPMPIATATPSPAGVLEALKKLLLGSQDVVEAAAPALAPGVKTIVVSEKSRVTQSCIVTTGETFAIWLNVLYLAPLTWLFVSFFVTSYVKRSNAAHKIKGALHHHENNVTLAEKAGWDAARDVEREVYGGQDLVQAMARNTHDANGTPDSQSDLSVASRVQARPRRRA
ncbi:hypothetical protein CDD82_3832 [Ophiocordyceps australis]|uniref:Elongation of fatty acids protein n=1 Tax=Ophiocordyceps australis TaxID=1399860 RepID=A0A2C5ZT74_9HYPO|nr:hypothetical protein CDD82_3832 [Ophiocordyceps australis]